MIKSALFNLANKNKKSLSKIDFVFDFMKMFSLEQRVLVMVSREMTPKLREILKQGFRLFHYVFKEMTILIGKVFVKTIPFVIINIHFP